MILAVIDSSVWAAALRSPNQASASRIILKASARGRVGIVVCDRLLSEVVEVLRRPKLGLSENEAREFDRFLRANAHLVVIEGNSYGCPDLDDDMLLESALVGGAAYVVTLDKDVLSQPFVIAARALGVQVVTPGAFLDELRRLRIVVGNEVMPDVSFLRDERLGSFLAKWFTWIESLVYDLAELERQPPDDDEAEIAVFLCERDGIVAELDETYAILRAALLTGRPGARAELKRAEIKAARYLSEKKLPALLRKPGLSAMPLFLLGDFGPDAPNRQYRRARMIHDGTEAFQREIEDPLQ
jgi:putative PIN family toxin of toxin-antitoxin system